MAALAIVVAAVAVVLLAGVLIVSATPAGRMIKAIATLEYRLWFFKALKGVI